jgi:metal-responsive CopG/Arc/MetJ family transcriptional regulator
MKVKTSITLSDTLLAEIDNLSGKNRSEFIEQVLRSYLRKRKKRERDARDREIIDKYADEINKEVEEVLGYQFGYAKR